ASSRTSRSIAAPARAVRAERRASVRWRCPGGRSNRFRCAQSSSLLRSVRELTALLELVVQLLLLPVAVVALRRVAVRFHIRDVGGAVIAAQAVVRADVAIEVEAHGGFGDGEVKETARERCGDSIRDESARVASLNHERDEPSAERARAEDAGRRRARK